MRSTQLLSILVAGMCLVVFVGQVTLAGRIVGWGDNWAGKASPPSGSDYVAIAAGGHHGLALKADGSLVNWGWDGDGQATPPAGNDYASIRAGLVHSIALKANGSILGWGSNVNGQATPPAGSDYVVIAAGGWHSLALKKDGSIVGWGSNGYGQATPPAGNDYTAIDAEGRHSLALKTDGSIVAWGISNEGAYDFGQVTDAPPGSNFVAIAAGWYHNIALKNDGSIFAWGISDGSADDYGQVTDTPTGNGFVAIAAGYWHNLALKTDGTIVGWGRENYNQTTPPPGKDLAAIGAGGDYSLVLTESAIGTGFIYQGRLIDADYPADDVYDFRFELYNDMTTGMQQGTTIYRDDVGVSDGYFTTGLDFGMDVFDSNALWLEISVRPGDVNDPNLLYTRLSPRQRITPAPYAVHANSSETVHAPLELSGSVAAPNSVLLVQNHHSAGIAISGKNTSTGYYGYLGTNTEGVHGWGGLAGVMGQSNSGRGLWGTAISGAGVYGEQFNSGNYGYIGTSDSGTYGMGMTPSSYGVYGIHNNSGNYGLLGSSTDGVYGLSNSSGGSGVAGIHNGSGNGVYGRSNSGHAGYFQGDTRVTANLTVDGNLGIGKTSPSAKLDVSGNINTSSVYKIAGETILSVLGSNNIFVGAGAGETNTGSRNTFVGNNSGHFNAGGGYNTFSGYGTGYHNNIGNNNTFLGYYAGHYNSFGNHNTFVGSNAGRSNNSGSYNTSLGYKAGRNNQTGSGNVFIGYKAGYNETDSDNLYIANGPDDANVLIYGKFSNGKIGIGTINPAYTLDVEGDVQAKAYHTGDIFFQKDGQKLWRMFEDKEGLYLEKLSTGKVYSIMLQEKDFDVSATDVELEMRKLRDINQALEQRIEALEKALKNRFAETN